MKKRVRTCGKRCHLAKGTRCRCWCGGSFHGKDGTGAANREAMVRGLANLEAHPGFKEGETAYIEQKELPPEVVSVK